MSDDLIRRNDVLNLLDKMYKQEKDLMRSIWVRNSIKDKIDEIPSAYDIDKVVEELKDCEIYNDMWVTINKAIEIVKKGVMNERI